MGFEANPVDAARAAARKAHEEALAPTAEPRGELSNEEIEALVAKHGTDGPEEKP